MFQFLTKTDHKWIHQKREGEAPPSQEEQGSTTQLGKGGTTALPKGGREAQQAHPKEGEEKAAPKVVKEGRTTQKEREISSFFLAVVRSSPRCGPFLLLMVLPSSAFFGWRGFHLFL